MLLITIFEVADKHVPKESDGGLMSSHHGRIMNNYLIPEWLINDYHEWTGMG